MSCLSVAYRVVRRFGMEQAVDRSARRLRPRGRSKGGQGRLPHAFLGRLLTVLLLTLAALGASRVAEAEVTVWHEGWEGSWEEDWHPDAGTWQAGEPESGPGEAFRDLNCAATVLAGNYSEGVDSRLIRHAAFVVPAATENPRLRFWHWFSFAWGDGGVVQIREAGTDEWESISNSYAATGSGVWTRPSVDLSAFAGQTVEIAFYFYSRQQAYHGPSVSSGWYVDEVAVVTGEPVFNNPENWESGLGDWWVDRGTWEVGSPTTGPGGGHSDTLAAGTGLAGNYHEGVDTRLVSPPYEVPAASESPRLRYWHWFSLAWGDVGVVQIREFGTDEWESVSNSHAGSSSGVWTRPSVDLSPYAGQTVEFAFYFYSRQQAYHGPSVSSGWYVDEVEVVTGDPVFDDPENWESGLGDWWVDRGTWEVGSPTTGPGRGHADTLCAGTRLDGNYSEGVDTRLVSPPYEVPAATESPRLRFWHWFSLAWGDVGVVQIREFGTDVWESLSTTYAGSCSGAWTRPSVDLSAYAGKTVEVAFYFYSRQQAYHGPSVSSGWFVDEVEVVTGEPVANNPEDWESGLGDWWVDRGTWEVGPPTTGPGAPYSGALCAGTRLDGNYSEGVDSRLVSPPWQVPPAADNPRLRFRHWHNFAWGDGGYVQIRAVGDSVGDWVSLADPYTGYSGDGGWTPLTYFSLVDYAGQTVEFGFYFYSRQQAYHGPSVSTGWYIDDLQVEPAELSPPQIACPAGPVPVEVCTLDEEICVQLLISNADEVVVDGATWSEGVLCFDADALGDYEFEVIASNGSGSDTCSVQVEVGMPEGPIACFTYAPGADSLEVVFESCSEPIEGLTHRWDFGDGFTSGETDPTHDFDEGGSYTVQLVVENECGADSTEQVILVGDEGGSGDPPTAKLYFAPENPCVFPDSLGIDSAVELWIASEVPVLGVDCTVEYDANKIEIVSTAPGSFFECGGGTPGDLTEFDNETGILTVSLAVVGGDSSGCSGAGNVLSILVRRLAEDPESAISFTSVSVRSPENREIPAEWVDGTVRAGGGLLGDFNGDGNVDFDDYTLFLWYFNRDDSTGDIASRPVPGEPVPPRPWSECNYPFGADGAIDFEDLVVFALMFDWSYENGLRPLGDLSASWSDPRRFSASNESRGMELSAQLAVPSEVAVGDLLTVRLEGIDLSAVVGYRFGLEYDSSTLVYEGTNLDELLGRAGSHSFALDREVGEGLEICRAVGGSRPSGALAHSSIEIRFRAIEESEATTVRLRTLELRTEANREVERESEGYREPFEVRILGDHLRPARYGLEQNAPNPFRSGTEIRFDLPESVPVDLTIYDVSGRVVRTVVHRILPAGFHDVSWDGRNDRGGSVSSGVYFYELRAGEFKATKRMLLTR